MNKDAALGIVERLSPSVRVVDVGGGASPFARADYVIDAIPFENKAWLGRHELGIDPRFSHDTWIQLDLCAHQPWPFPDKFFDFATCSHLLEDVRDPIWICSELSRVAKAGYIEVPSRVIEQSLGVEHPCYAGYHHHRWLIDDCGGNLEFRHKPHLLHSLRDAIVARVGVQSVINPKHAIISHYWTDRVSAREVLEFDERAVIQELCEFAASARKLRDLTVSAGRTLTSNLKRAVYYTRLAWGSAQ